MKRQHIDDAQASTAAEHFDLLMKEESQIDQENSLTPDDLPDWYNEKLFNKCRNYYMRNIFSIHVAHITGLLIILSVPDILKIIVFTKQSSTSCMAFKRYSRTGLYIHDLYTCDENNPNSKFYKALNMIRLKHKTTNKRSQDCDIGNIYQRDMILTQFGFIGPVVIAPKIFGLLNKPEEEEALNHFWRVIGHMLGIPDRINVCRKNVTETNELCQIITANVFANYLRNPPMHFDQIITRTTDGLWYFNVICKKSSMVALMYKTIGIKNKVPLEGWYDWLNIKYFDLKIYLFTVQYVGPILRTYYNYLTIFSIWMVDNCPFLAWISFGKKNSQLNLYPH